MLHRNGSTDLGVADPVDNGLNHSPRVRVRVYGTRDSAFDMKAFAGRFAGTLPCADCPGIDESLVLSADGSFELTDTYRERPGSEQVLRGNWALEPDGRSIRLDPGRKDARDRLFAIDDDALVPLGADGEPTGAPGDPRLRRIR